MWRPAIRAAQTATKARSQRATGKTARHAGARVGGIPGDRRLRAGLGGSGRPAHGEADYAARGSESVYRFQIAEWERCDPSFGHAAAVMQIILLCA